MSTGTARYVLPIPGLGDAGFGLAALQRTLASVPGVRTVYASSATEMAYVTCDPEVTRPEHLIAAVETLGLWSGTPQPR